MGTLRIGKYEILEADPDAHDPRGIVWIWEEPRSSAQYVLAADPTVGITGWSRSLRTKEDARTDNAAIQVLKVGTPDVQVAEFAAPIDTYELAPVVNFLGRMYGGSQEEGQALACIEVAPGPGWSTQTELVQKFGYTNLPPWILEGGLSRQITPKFGWHSSRSTRRDLWIKGMHHINSRKVVIQSPHLIEEMVDCKHDNFLSATARAGWGAHDDRVVAFLIALWYAHEWSMDWAPTDAAKPEVVSSTDYQNCDISLEGMEENWNEKFNAMMGDE